jgi:hypothetical protein
MTRKYRPESQRFAHLILGEPTTTGDKLALHLPHQRHWTAEANRSETQKVANDLADSDRLRRRNVRTH